MNVHHIVRLKRAQVELTQPELAAKVSLGLRYILDLEQGKKTVRIDKVNQVLWLFGAELGPININRDLLLEKFEKAAIHS